MKTRKKIILALNRPLGIIKRPFYPVAKRLGWKESRVLKLVKAYKANGLIRRLGFVLAHRNIGLKSNVLVAWIVPKKNLLSVAGVFQKTAEVSHCYERATYSGWPYNIYTMIHASNKRACLGVIRRLSRDTGVKEYLPLFTLKELKKTRGSYA